MKNRLPLALALALAAAACTPPQAGSTYDQKVSKVEQLTRALSLSQNEELKQAAGSVQTLGSSMTQGGFAGATAAAGGLVAAGGGNMVAAGGGNLVAAGGGNVMVNNGGNLVAAGGGNYLLTALVTDLNAATRKDVYKLLGTIQGAANSSISYDDATGELTGISDGQTTCAFAFKNEGSKRTWTIDVQQSPDGTTGTMSFEISADVWNAAAPPQPAPAFPQPDDQASDQPADQDWWGDDANGEQPVDDAPTDEEAGDDQADFGLSQAGAQVKIFNNEVPDANTLTAFRFTCDLTPRGDAKLRVKLDAAIDDVKQTASGRMPTHLRLNLTVPTVQFTSDTNFDGATAFASKGGLKVRTPEATESLTYDLALKLGANTGKLDLVHEGAKVRLNLIAKPGSRPGVPETESALYDTETQQKVADLVPAPGEQNVLLIKFTNGKTVRWDLMGGTTSALPGATGGAGGDPVRPSDPPTPRPARPSATPFIFN